MGALKRELVGKTYPAQTYTVTAEATKRYALATNDPNPWYLDESRPGGIVAPPLFAVVPAYSFLTTVLTDPGLQLPLDRVLHGEQDMYFFSPIRPGDVLVSSGRVAAVEERSTGETLTVEVVSLTEAGEERVRQLLTAFIRDPSRRGGGREQVADRGAPVAQAVMQVTEDQPYRYAEASGDYNPPHVNEEFAKMIGFRTVILQGLCTMAFAAKAVVDELCRGDPTRLRRLKVRFSKVVYPGDVLTTRIWEEAAGRYALETTNQDGGLVIRDGVVEIAQ